MRDYLNTGSMICFVSATAILLAIARFRPVEAHPHPEPQPRPWTASISYVKDERTQACFATVLIGAQTQWTYVPCELVDKANWQAYDKGR